jgi:cell division protein FtsL
MIVMTIVVSIALFHVWRRHHLIRVGYELSDASEELRATQEDNRRLKLERSVLTNPDRIERLATAMGMRRPEPTQIRIVRPGEMAAATSAGDEDR